MKTRREFDPGKICGEADLLDGEFPMRIVVYDSDGNYTDPRVIASQAELDAELEGAVIAAIRARYEIKMFTARGNCCLHAKDGRLLFPDLGQPTARQGPPLGGKAV